MRYLVRARVKPGFEKPLLEAIERRTLGRGSVAGGEYLRNMTEARQMPEGEVRWVEVCYCPTPLQEETPYWEEFFELVKVQDAHDRRECRDFNGTESWACHNCDCTARLEKKLSTQGDAFLYTLVNSKPR
jgi:poly-beta-hydroxyalkanoate depolymerase